MSKYLILIITLLFITTTTFSQSTKKFIDTGSVKNQFDYVINESNSYQDFKVIKSNWLLKLKSNVTDSLLASKKDILTYSETKNSQQKIIDSLKTALTNSQTTINSLNEEKQSISFFGIPFEKSVFKTLLFLIIIGLAILLGFFITKFKQSNSITIQTKLLLKDLEEEFEIHRKNALEREQKAMRKLQDELNKQKKD